MMRFSGMMAGALLLLMTAVAPAQYRADFFDNTRKPTVTFNEKSLTWTLKNQAVERVIRFDAKTGALTTVACRNLKTRHDLRSAPNGEGAISFVAPLLEPPTLLRGWRMTLTAPPANWLKPEFDDAAWKTPAPLSPSPSANTSTGTAFFRCVLPADRMKPDHAYAILFDHAFPSYNRVELFLDGELVQTLKREDRAWGRTIQIDATAKNRVVGIKLTAPTDALALAGTVAIAEAGTSPASLDLSSNWTYRYHAINVTPSGSQVLTIALSGVKKYERFDLSVNYEILPGDEPFIVKWFGFVSHRPTRFLLEEVVTDRWLLAEGKKGRQEEGKTTPNTQNPTLYSLLPTYSFAAFNAATIAADGQTGQGFVTAALSPLGATTQSEDGASVSVEIRPYTLVKPDLPLTLPKTLTGLFSGSVASGIFLHQWYVGAYQSETTPETFPIAYNTTYPFGTQISAATCDKLIPLASEIGAKLFVVGDGWQVNATPEGGRKGDWITDRAPEKFPMGLMPVSLNARMQRMRFGLWTDPVEVDDGAKSLLDHPEWRLQTAAGVNTHQMCFTSGWEDLFSSSMSVLCRELMATYLELDRDMLHDGCIDPAHLHPVAHSLEQQLAHRDIFHAKMSKVAPNFLVSGTDQLRRADYLAPVSPEQENAAWWLARADQARRRIQTLLLTRPPFAVIGTVPAHLPVKQENLPALEYYYASVAGLTGNLEWQGDLMQLTAGEKTLAIKWAEWTTANREWLAYAQPLALVGMESTSAEGILHLRNAYKGKHGLICLYNPTDAPITIEPGFRPADYALKMNPSALTMNRVSNAASVEFLFRNGIVQLKPITLAPHGWEIVEVKTK